MNRSIREDLRMKALRWHGKADIRCEEAPDPRIEDARDAIIKVSSCAICGSDLHLYGHFMPGMQKGDIVGHEFMGEVVEVGRGSEGQAQGGRAHRGAVHDRLRPVRPVQARQLLGLPDHEPQQDDRGRRLRPHHRGAVRLHPSHRRLCRRARPNTCACLRRRHPHQDPESMPDEQALFLGDIFPTGWQGAVQCDIQPTDTVAIWGCGPGRPVRDPLRGAARRQAGGRHRPVPERLAMARAGGAITINFDEESVVERLNELTGGRGPEKCIDCVGMEAHITSTVDAMYDRPSRPSCWRPTGRTCCAR
jgi:threonine dehydrogenase-like Zn-dependent dehydrogenase